MTESTPPPSSGAPASDDISLENIDALLESEDPEFSKQLKDVASVAPAADVVIETSTEAVELDPSEQIDAAPTTFKGKAKLWLKNRIQALIGRMKTGLAVAARELLIFLKTRPKEFLLFSFAMFKILLKSLWIPIKAFQAASGTKKLAILTFLLLGTAAIAVGFANFKKGIWIPQINEPILNSLEDHATGVEDYTPSQQDESFYSAFPQERHEYLFNKFKVNLSRNSEHPNPMGAFEIIVLLDSRDTAIEVGDRRVEFFDLMQRALEEETFESLETEIGKSRLKSKLKRELNQKLTQGWVKDISFKTFILKP